MEPWWLWAAIAGVVVLYAVYLYNRLVTLRQRVAAAWAQIDVQLKRRHELIPNLVASVKGYMAHERGVFDALVRAREKAVAAGDDVTARAGAENAVTQAMRSLFALAESTPELRASETMVSFQEELSSTENRIAFARQHYNDAVMDYNTTIESVPSVVLARSLAFTPKPLFEVEDAQRQVVAVAFDAA